MGQVNAGCRDWIKQIPAKYAATLQIKAQPKIEESRITQQSETIIIPAQSTIGLFILLFVIEFLMGLFHEFPISPEAPVSPVFGIDFIKRISINFTFMNFGTQNSIQ